MSAKCVIGEYCHRHGFVHGGEAEELRSRIEQLVSDFEFGDERTRLQRVLDEVDARDSLALLESLKV